ncbi:hypothetical protein [Luteolibacter sp. Populi]|uniref:hypothetical protein n=1 Tax=Luteolibacter sp. Populi TaxID=3230487 RepID=UPI003465422C
MDPAFQKDFLRDFRRGNSGLALALFGKHPAWNDHMDDFGLATPTLRTCKRLLYLQGLAANAAREQSEAAPVTPYRHSLFWLREREAVLIRLVESEDGRGRHFFPLVAAAHLELADEDRALRLLLPALRGFVDAGRLLGSREAVSDLHQRTQAQLAAEIRHLPGGEGRPEAPSAEEAAVLKELAASGHFMIRRVPVSRYDPVDSIAFLATAWRTLGSDRPLLVACGDSDPALTLAAGEPEKADFWFLRRP